MRRKVLTSASFLVTGGFGLVIACSEDTGTQLLTGGAAGMSMAGTGPSAGGNAAGGVTGTGGATAGSSGNGTAGSAGAGKGTATCGNMPMPGGTCTGTGNCMGSRNCSCTNGTVGGMFCGGGFQMQQQGGSGMAGTGGTAPGGIDCGANPSNGDACPAVGICMGGQGCQCAPATLVVYGCTGGGGGNAGETGEAGETGTNGGTAGSAGSSGTAGTAGAGGAAGINCPANPQTSDPCTGGPGVCPNTPTCICTAPPNGMVQCQ